jgi:alkaline phosphatase D
LKSKKIALETQWFIYKWVTIMNYFCLMKSSITLLAILISFLGSAQHSNETVIAFGSCNDEQKPQEMWKEVIAQKPTLWIWGGDNVYANDNEDLALLKKRYEKQKSNPDYQKLINICSVTGTWDDHDYGINDAGKYFAKKKESKNLLFDFLGMGKSNLAWAHTGVYNSVVIGQKNQRIKVINLDTRYFRDTVIKFSFVDTLTQKTLTNYKVNPTGDILGEDQWQWLTNELQDREPELFILNSSIQVIPDEHRFEKWSNFPSARARLLALLEASKKNVIIISGDRHISEFSQLALPGLAYPLTDFTSSGLTHTWSDYWVEENTYRKGELIIQRSFGLIKVDWSSDGPRVVLQSRGLQGVLHGEQVIRFGR